MPNFSFLLIVDFFGKLNILLFLSQFNFLLFLFLRHDALPSIELLEQVRLGYNDGLPKRHGAFDKVTFNFRVALRLLQHLAQQVKQTFLQGFEVKSSHQLFSLFRHLHYFDDFYEAQLLVKCRFDRLCCFHFFYFYCVPENCVLLHFSCGGRLAKKCFLRYSIVGGCSHGHA